MKPEDTDLIVEKLERGVVDDPEAVLLRQLAAVHQLLSADHRALEYDILITSILDCLRHGAKMSSELLKAINDAWPGVQVDYTRISAALHTAQAAGYVTPAGEPADQLWALTTMGAAEAGSSDQWAQAAISRTGNELKARARQLFPGLTEAQVRLWVGLISRALFAGMSDAASGAIAVLPDRTIAPQSFHRDRMTAVIDQSVSSPDVAEFLKAMLLAAVDQSDPFGNELVSHVATGYLLHAILGHQDRPTARATLGTIEGVKNLLDTPILLGLLGPNPRRKALEEGIHAAIRAGMDVIVPDHVIEELLDVVDRLDRDTAPHVEAALSEGADSSVLQQTVDDEVIQRWLEARQQSLYASWSDFLTAALNIEPRLHGLGVKRESLKDDLQSEQVLTCEQSLTAMLKERSVGRGKTQIARDARTMAVTWQYRGMQREKGRFWPPAWVVTTDRSMGSAYSRISPSDRLPFTLTPSQWLTLLSVFGTPAQMELLARSAANLLSDDLVLSVAAKYPAEVAVELSKALAPTDDISSTDVRIAQMTMDELLGEECDAVDNAKGSAARIATAIVTRKTQRMTAVHTATTSRLADEQQELRTQLDVLNLNATEDRRALQEATERIAELTTQNQQLRADNKAEIRALQQQHANDALLAKRRGRVTVIALVLLVVALAAWYFRGLVTGLATVAPLIIFLMASREWVDNPEASWTRMLWTVVAEVPAFILYLRDIFHLG